METTKCPLTVNIINKMWYIYIYIHIYAYILIYNRIFCAQSLSHAQLCVTPWTASHQSVHSWDFSGKNTGVSCYFSSGDLLNSRIKPASPALVGIFFTTEPLEKPYNGILLSHNMSEIMPFAATWMNLEIIILNKLSQMEKDKYHMIICM